MIEEKAPSIGESIIMNHPLMMETNEQVIY